MHDPRTYWIWLQQSLPLGCPETGLLLDSGLRPEALYQAGKKELEGWGLTGSRMEKLLDKSLDRAQRILEQAVTHTDWILTPDDAYYPDVLREIVGPPLVLYCRGDLPDLNRWPGFGIVGTRRASETGRQNAATLSAGLAAAGLVIISGGAAGIDAAAHAGALLAQGRTVVVRPCPLESEYPIENRSLRQNILDKDGAWVTEFPPGTTARCDFHVRNRLISGMSIGVCLAETPEKSGALITASLAREQGRDVFVMPGDLPSHRNDGGHRQIQNGAMLITGPRDILEEYRYRYPGLLDSEAAEKAAADAARRWTSEERPPAHPKRTGLPRRPKHPSSVPEGRRPLPEVEEKTAPSVGAPPDTASEAAKAVWAALTDQPEQMDILAQEAQLPPAQILAALTELELYGCVCRTAGQRYGRRRIDV